MYHDDNGSEGPKGTFEIYRAEADNLYKQAEYRKAIESYTIALELTPNEKNCLVARSRCYLQLGDMQSALMDAETSLTEENDFHKGIYQKAQALYYQGDFEMALVYYHRGHKLRPELQEFRLGIQKAQEAIDNSVGCKYTPFPAVSNLHDSALESDSNCKTGGSNVSVQRYKSDWSLSRVFPSYVSTSTGGPSTRTLNEVGNTRRGKTVGRSRAPDKVKLTTEGDLSFFALQDEKLKRKGKTYGRQLVQQQLAKTHDRKSVGSEKTIKQLLGELYGDRQYLEKLLKETDPNTDMGKTISTLVHEGLSYLDTRSDFWRQQKPMYARKHDRIMQRRKREVTSSKLTPNDYIIKELERIDQAQVEGRYQEALKRSQKCLTTVQNFTEDEVSNKTEVIANLHSCIGNAYLEMGSYDKALDNHQADLNMGETNDLQEAVSRGLDNLGRVHARSGQFDKAVNVWERKIPMSKSPLESTWLYHEIGRCYLELDKYSRAKEYGDQSLTAAIEAEDQMWQLQATVLTAQAEVKLNEFQAASATFEKSLELAKAQGDSTAEIAIQKAIDDVNARIIAGEGITANGETETGEDQTADENINESAKMEVEQKKEDEREDTKESKRVEDSKETTEKMDEKQDDQKEETEDEVKKTPNTQEQTDSTNKDG